jgi:hypothetical protein
MEAWFTVWRRGLLRNSRFYLFASFTCSTLKLKNDPQSVRHKYVLNFELVALTVKLKGCRILLKPVGCKTVFVMEQEDLELVRYWGQSMLLCADANLRSAFACKFTSKFRWWKVIAS